METRNVSIVMYVIQRNIMPGDLKTFRRRHSIHVVVGCQPDSHVYEVKPVAKGRIPYYRVTFYNSHRNHKQNEDQNSFEGEIQAQLKLYTERNSVIVIVMTPRF